MRYDVFTQRLVDAVLNTPGETPSALRNAVMKRGSIPAPLVGYVSKVSNHAYKVTDEEVAALKRAGHSDDALFEVTVSAAVGAALYRIKRGMAALQGKERG